MLQRLARLSGVVAGLALLILAGPSGQVSAHADLVRAEPAVDAKVAQAPATLVLHFSQGVKQQGSFIQISDGGGTQLPLTVAFEAADSKVMTGTPGSPLQPGVYTVKWQTLSADDDDYHDGTYQITVLNPDGSSPEGPTSSVGPEDDCGGGSDTVILVAVTAVVVFMVAALVVYIRKTGRSAAK